MALGGVIVVKRVYVGRPATVGTCGGVVRAGSESLRYGVVWHSSWPPGHSAIPISSLSFVHKAFLRQRGLRSAPGAERQRAGLWRTFAPSEVDMKRMLAPKLVHETIARLRDTGGHK